jgi:hypothetical protein
MKGTRRRGRPCKRRRDEVEKNLNKKGGKKRQAKVRDRWRRTVLEDRSTTNYLETSVNNYQHTLHNNPEEQRPEC